jgi:colicin import membrane protein
MRSLKRRLRLLYKTIKHSTGSKVAAVHILVLVAFFIVLRAPVENAVVVQLQAAQTITLPKQTQPTAEQQAAKEKHIAAQKAKALAKKQAQAKAVAKAKAQSVAKVRERARLVAKRQLASREQADARAKRIQAAKAAKAAKAVKAAKLARELAQLQQKQAAALQQSEQAKITAQNKLIAKRALINKYTAQIIAQISQNWLVPAGISSKLRCVLDITLAPGGVVMQASLAQSSGNVLLDRSAIAAVYKASPLPVPSGDDFAAFRSLELNVTPQV